MKIWIVYTEVTPEKNCNLPSHAVGAFVECYLLAENIDHALFITKESLQNDSFNIVEISKCFLYEDEDWDDDNDPDREVRDAAKEAYNTNELVYGPFRTFDE